MATYETHGPITGVAYDLYYIPSNGAPNQILVQSSSKGIVKYTLKRNGSALASAQRNLADISTTGVNWCSFTTGTEADNGSTAEEIIYTLDAAAAPAGEYTMEVQVSGKVGTLNANQGPGGAYDSGAFTVNGNGNFTAVLTLLDDA